MAGGRGREAGKGAQNSGLPYLDLAYLAPGRDHPIHWVPRLQIGKWQLDKTRQDNNNFLLFASYTTWYIDCFPNNLKLQSSLLSWVSCE